MRSKLRFADVLNVGTLGLRARKARTVLTALGIAIGIAAMIAVLGITSSSDAQLQADLDALGPNLLEITPGDSVTGDDVVFPAEAAEMVERIGTIQAAAAVSPAGTTVRRTDLIPAGQTGGISVLASDIDLLEMIDGEVADGSFLDQQSAQLPNIVLGSVAAERLGIHSTDNSPQVYLTNTYFTVVGILDPVELAPNIDRSALIGQPITDTLFETDKSPSLVYARTSDDVPDDAELFDSTRAVIAATVIPAAPNEVSVSRPSDLLEARESTAAAFTGLLLGLGAVALLVGGVGIANVMVISVLERRTEIGVRRALGATKRHIRLQFIVESALLSLLGGIGGVAIGAAITAGYANNRGWVISVPVSALGLGVGAALLIGALAGLYPAARAARLDPAEAVRPAG
ncbi:MAG: ABC transporter permease [Acidimicrobiales bacterium]